MSGQPGVNDRSAPVVFQASARARVVAVLAAVGAAGVAVFSFGAAANWWAGRSCALGACGADDIEWVWFVVFAVAVAATAAFAVLAWQVVRDRTVMHHHAVWVRSARGLAVDWATIDRFEVVDGPGGVVQAQMVMLGGEPIQLRGLTIADDGRGVSVDALRSTIDRFTDRTIPIDRP